MPRGIQKKGIIREEKMLSAAIELFLKNGYEKTSHRIHREGGRAIGLVLLRGL